MSRNPAYILLAAFVMTLFCAACHKDPVSPVQGYKSILTAGPWRLHIYSVYVRVNAARVDTLDELAAMPPCVRDDRYTFKSTNGEANGDLLIDEGPTKCDSSLPQQLQSQWWNIPYSDGKTFIINDGNFANSYSIEYVSDSVLRLSQGEGYDPFRNQMTSCVIVYRRVY